MVLYGFKIQDFNYWSVSLKSLKFIRRIKKNNSFNYLLSIYQVLATIRDSGVYLQYAYARTNSLLEKTDKLHHLEKDWQEIYLGLIKKEEEIRKEEKELKDSLSEFIGVYKKSLNKDKKR